MTIYEKIAELGLIMILHAGWDVSFPDSMRAGPEACAKMAGDFPGAKIVLAHFGGMMRWDGVERHLCGRDVYFDLSFVNPFLDPAQAKRMIGLHDPEKLLFGTDCPWSAAPDLMKYIDGLGLDAALREKIYYKNALRLLGE